MELTPEGKVLYDRCKDILNRTEQLENIMKDFGKERLRLRLGVPPMIGSLILPNIYKDFCPLNPDISLEIIEGRRNELLDKLKDNHLDMVFLLQNNQLDAKFVSKKITELEIVCCASKDNPVSKYKSVTPASLKCVPLVLFENSFFQTELIKKWFQKDRITPDILMQTKQLSTMLSMILSNRAAGFMFRDLTQTHKNLVAIPTEPQTYVSTSIVWNKDSYHLSCMEKFINYLNKRNPFDIK